MLGYYQQMTPTDSQSAVDGWEATMQIGADDWQALKQAAAAGEWGAGKQSTHGELKVTMYYVAETVQGTQTTVAAEASVALPQPTNGK